MGHAERDDEVVRLVRTMETLDAQRAVLGDEPIELALAPLRARLAELRGAPAPDRTEGAPEYKVVTVVFADISGFTALSERLSPEDVREVMNGVFDRLVPTVERYGGVIDKFIGDEIMALFGAPQATEHHADHALRACLGMFQELARFNEVQGTALGLHIGVNSGRVVAGAIGSVGRHDYSVMGDTVNVAARLEAASETGEVLVGPSVYRATRSAFDFEPLPPMALKGKAQPLPVFRLLSARPRREEVNDGLLLQFQGRDAELEQISGLVASGATAITLTGQPGLGKSRLVAEVRRRVSPRSPWIEVAAMAHRSSASYALFHDLFDEIVGVEPGADGPKVAAALTDHLASALPDRDSTIAPLLRRFRGLPKEPGDDDVAAGMAPDVLRRRLHRSVADLLATATDGGRVVVCVEDLHWADPSSIRLLTDLVVGRMIPGLTFLVTCRTDSPRAEPFLEGVVAQGSDAVILLRPLAPEVVADLLERTMVGPGRSSPVVGAMLEHSDGNPFYVVSYLRTLIDEGAAVLDGGRVHLLREPGSLRLPDSLHALVSERVDRLPPDAKSVLRMAAVVGRRFRVDVVTRLAAELAAAEPDGSLADLCERQLLETSGGGHLQFVHAVVQDAVADGMLARDRRRLHLAVVAVLDRDATVDHAVCAWHLEQAGEGEDASARYELAADAAQVLFANADALTHVQRAFQLAALTDSERRAALSERSGGLLHATGRFVDAAERYGEIAVASSGVVGARRSRLQAHSLIACQRLDAAEDALALARVRLDEWPGTRAAPWWREHFAVEGELMWLLYLASRADEMQAVAVRLAPEIEAHGTRDETGAFHRNLALLDLRTSLFSVGPDTVARAARGAADLAEGSDRGAACFASFTHAFALLWSGQRVAAEQHLRAVLDEARAIGDGERHLLCLTYLGLVARMRHDVESARAYATASVAAARIAGSRLYEGVSLANLAWAAWRSGDAPAGVRAELAGARTLMAALPGYPFHWIVLLPDAAVAAASGERAVAAEACRHLLAPGQQRLSDPLTAALSAAVETPTPAALLLVRERAEADGLL